MAGGHLHRCVWRRKRSGGAGGEPDGGRTESATPERNIELAELLLERGRSVLSICGAAAAKAHAVPIFLTVVAGCSLAIGLFFTLMPIVEFTATEQATGATASLIRRRLWPFFILPCALFFVRCCGKRIWILGCVFRKDVGQPEYDGGADDPIFLLCGSNCGAIAGAVSAAKFPEVRLVQAGLLLACAGMTGMIFPTGWREAAVSSACAAGLGLSSVYPITISILSKDFGASSSRIGSIMFVLSNIGGGLSPWIVGVTSTGFGTLKAGLVVPLVASAAMYVLYLQDLDRTQIAQS